MKTYQLKSSVIILSLALLFSCSKSYNSSNNNYTASVSMGSMSFSPSSLTVTAGTTVTWTNNDTEVHTVTADDNSFNSGDMIKGNTFSQKFNNKGTYQYHCIHHSPMTGTITVN